MILVDDQSGSKDLYPYIKQLVPDTVLTRIHPPFGDIAWVGDGPDNKSISVGVEYKQIDDVLKCMVDGRFAGHQLPGLLENYDRVYLLIEGRIRVDRNTGILQKQSGERWRDINRAGRGFMGRDLEHWCTTMEEKAQIRVAWSRDSFQSARWVQYKHSWWVNKGWEEHKSMQQFHIPPPPAALFTKPGFTRRVVKEFPDVGWDRSDPVAKHFKNVYNAVTADAGEWAKIVVGGNRLGHTLTIGVNRAQSIFNKLRGMGDDR